MSVHEFLSPKQAARAIGVSESSLKRWCDRGQLSTVRTAGGHRRLAVEHVVEFLRKSGRQLVRPELLHFPSNGGRGETALARARDRMLDALVAGNEELCRRIVLDLYLAGRTVAEIGDQVIAEAFAKIGERWDCRQVEVFQERRACELCQRVVSELRAMIPLSRDEAPLAIGGAPEGDRYSLPTALVELIFRQQGWRTQSLGNHLPISTLLAAVEAHRPRVLWLSVSHLEDERRFGDEYNWLYSQMPADVAIVVGGRALSEPLRRQMQYASFCDNLRHLEAFARTLNGPVSGITTL